MPGGNFDTSLISPPAWNTVDLRALLRLLFRGSDQGAGVGSSILDTFAWNAELEKKTATTIGFRNVSSALTPAKNPRRICKDGRVGIITTDPASLTISGAAGTKYIYADIAADGSVTLLASATSPLSETTAYRAALGEVAWDGSQITSVVPYFSAGPTPFPTPWSIANGGTGRSTIGAANTIAYSDGGALQYAQLTSAMVGNSFPRVRVTKSATQNLPATTVTVITWDAVSYDSNSQWSAGEPGRITFNTAGTYLVWASIEVGADMQDGGFIDVRLNGTTVIARASCRNGGSVVTVYPFLATHYVEFRVSNQAASARTLQTTSTAGAIFLQG